MISLDFRDSRPVYEQICDKIKELIVSGALKAGDRTMSVRELASTLTINPNTIVKAYKQLETDGYIYSVQGKGYFVAEKSYAASDTKIFALKKGVEENLKELCFLGVKKDDIYELTDKIWKARES